MKTRLRSLLRGLPEYLRFFRPDLLAGATVALIAIPQAMAYAAIAGVSPLYGLYTAVIPAIIGVFAKDLFGTAWNFQTKFFVNIIFGTCVFFTTSFWWKGSSQAFKAKVDAFFVEMKTPVDVEKELGDIKSRIKELSKDEKK